MVSVFGASNSDCRDRRVSALWVTKSSFRAYKELIHLGYFPVRSLYYRLTNPDQTPTIWHILRPIVKYERRTQPTSFGPTSDHYAALPQ
jgi:hypothetical protein